MLEDMASALVGCSIAMVAAFQVGSWVGLDSLEDLNQPNILMDNLYLKRKRKRRRQAKQIFRKRWESEK